MLLAIDIGNTAIKFGVFDGEDLNSKFTVPTKRYQDSAELRTILDKHLPAPPENVIVSSVVPELNAAIVDVFPTARLVKPTDDLGLKQRSYAADSTGTDRLINSFAAAELYGTPCIVISFGTATTIDAVNKDREHLGGIIAPGPKATAKALELITSQLPDVDIAEQPNVISTTTEGAIRSGIFYSQIGLVEVAIPLIKYQVGESAKVIATGGFASLIASKCSVVDVVEPDLTLIGLKMLHVRG